MSSMIPVFPGVPLLGSLPAFRRNRLDVLGSVFERCGPMAQLKLGPRRAYVVTDPELAREVLTRQARSFRKFEALTNYSRPLLGNGLVSSDGDFHRRQRKLVAPQLKRRQIASYIDAMARHADALASEWAEAGRADVIEGMVRTTLAIAAETLFGADAAHHAPVVGRAVRVQTAYTATEVSRLVHVPASWPTPRNRRLRAAVRELEAIVYDLIDRRRRSDDPPDDLLTSLLAAQDEDDGRVMTDEQVRDEVMTMFAAGHETVSNSSGWALWLLATHPDIQSRLAEETRAVLDGRPPTFEDLPELGYASQVFKETMRLYPPVYLVGRESTEPVTIGDWSLPADATVIVNIFGIHHRPDLYPDPKRFDPERFTPEAEDALPRCGFLPFADGPRVCVGNHFALAEGQILLGHLVQRLKLAPLGQPPVPLPQLTLQQRDPFFLQASPRA